MNPSERHTVAAYFNVRNCADLLAMSIQQVLWADEIIIADASDNQEIANLCRLHYPRAKHLFLPVDDLFQRLVEALPNIESDYILTVDSDEFYTPELGAEILLALKKPCEFDGFIIPQIFYNYGDCWGPGAAWLRLFRRDRHHLPLSGSAHLMPTVDGPTRTLEFAYHHHNNPKLSINAAKHFRYEAINAARLSDSELARHSLESLSGARLIMHALKSMLRVNVRFAREFLAHRKHGFSGLCHAYSLIIRTLAEDVCPTEEQRMRHGKLEKGNRGYF